MAWLTSLLKKAEAIDESTPSAEDLAKQRVSGPPLAILAPDIGGGRRHDEGTRAAKSPHAVAKANEPPARALLMPPAYHARFIEQASRSMTTGRTIFAAAASGEATSPTMAITGHPKC